MRRSMATLWRLLAVLSLLGVTGVLGLPATHAADQTPTLLRYAFRQGALFTMHFNLTSSKTIQQPHYPDRHFHEVTTGLEQATIAKVLRDGGALFQYRFAGLVNTGMASPAQYVIDASVGPAQVAAAQYAITQAVGADGRAEIAAQQCRPFAGLEDLSPFTLLPLTVIPYATHPVAVGDTWTALLPPDDHVVGQAHVQLLSQRGTNGRFRETATMPIHIADPKQVLRLSGTTLLTSTVTQDLTTGVPSAWEYQITTAIARTESVDTPGNVEVLHYLSSQSLSATLTPNAQFSVANATPMPTATPNSMAAPTPVIQTLSPAQSALARLNLGITDLPGCYRLVVSIPLTSRGIVGLFPAPLIGFSAGHAEELQGELQGYPDSGGSRIDAAAVRFVDAAHAHAYLVQVSTELKHRHFSLPELHGLQPGDEQVVDYGAYGPFDLAQQELAYLNYPGQFFLIFRRGPYLVDLQLYGDFAPIDLGIYGQQIDQRLQRALATSASP
jgi:hypothetical protein